MKVSSNFLTKSIVLTNLKDIYKNILLTISKYIIDSKVYNNLKIKIKSGFILFERLKICQIFFYML